MTPGLRTVGAVLFALALGGLAAAKDFTLSVIHTNDIHSHAEPSRVRDVTLGGFARQSGLIKKLRSESANPIVLNAGDSFQGTIFFNVYEGMAEAAFMNLAGFQAMALGNHEFDKGPASLGRFLDQVTFPVLAANIDVSSDPALAGKVKPSAIIDVNGEKVGVVGAVTPDTPNISSPGPTVKWLDPVISIQREVDRLTVQSIGKIIVLSHMGYREDLDLAGKLRGVDVIVGGHSHSVLGDLGVPGFTRKDGDYPTIRKGLDGKDTLVVQAWEWGKVVGKLDVTFDAAGDIKSFKGRPVLVDDKAPVDQQVAAMVAAFRKPVESLISQKVGETAVELGRGPDGLMGFIVADAQLDFVKDKGVVAAFMNPGGVRRNLGPGTVSYGDLVEVQPFTNTLVIFDLTGADIRAMIELGLANERFLIPSAGTSYRVEGGKAAELVIAGAPVEDAKVYKIVVNSFMAGGGDSLTLLRDTKSPKVDTGFVDVDALVAWFRKSSPVTAVPGPRIKRS
jgi:5'-nucleotidase